LPGENLRCSVTSANGVRQHSLTKEVTGATLKS
jgi:hypothetical protein